VAGHSASSACGTRKLALSPALCSSAVAVTFRLTDAQAKCVLLPLYWEKNGEPGVDREPAFEPAGPVR